MNSSLTQQIDHITRLVELAEASLMQVSPDIKRLSAVQAVDAADRIDLVELRARAVLLVCNSLQDGLEEVFMCPVCAGSIPSEELIRG